MGDGFHEWAMSALRTLRRGCATGVILATVPWTPGGEAQPPLSTDGSPVGDSPAADFRHPAEARVADGTTPLIHLDLKLPAYQLDVFLRHERVRSYRVVFGAPNYRTPRGQFEITQLQWNPRWIPPKAPLAQGQRVTAPGPTNSLGKVELPFRGLHVVHGTSDVASLGKPSSRGCVRLANPDVIELATLLQRELVGIYASDSVLRAVLPSRRTMTVALSEPVPMDVRYDLSDVVADTLFIYPDPYRLGSSPVIATLRALTRAGLDTNALDFVRVRHQAQFPKRAPVALPVKRPPWP